ncbi:hypothetical protein BH10PSE12_BH10PSE12_19200 [soil metagenome]
MTAHLKLRIHISEPWDFERSTGLTELLGWTIDHVETPEQEMNREWEVTLDSGFDFHERRIARLLISPRYVGEQLTRIYDAVVGFPVRIAYRKDGGWLYAMTGMLAVRYDEEEKKAD